MCIVNDGFHVLNEFDTCEACGMLVTELLRDNPPAAEPAPRQARTFSPFPSMPPLPPGEKPSSARTDTESYAVATL